MVSKRKIEVPLPKSKFLRVKCKSCGNEQIIFSHASTVVRCFVCEEALAEPTGGKARVYGRIIGELGV